MFTIIRIIQHTIAFIKQQSCANCAPIYPSLLCWILTCNGSFLTWIGLSLSHSLRQLITLEVSGTYQVVRGWQLVDRNAAVGRGLWEKKIPTEFLLTQQPRGHSGYKGMTQITVAMEVILTTSPWWWLIEDDGGCTLKWISPTWVIALSETIIVFAILKNVENTKTMSTEHRCKSIWCVFRLILRWNTLKTR